MSVYDFDLQGIRNAFLEFNQSIYGRTVFLLAYILPFALFIASAVTILFAIFYKFDATLLYVGEICIIAFVPTFILGNIYFYSEIRRFCEYKEGHKHSGEKKK